MGKDVYSGVLYGARISLAVGLLAAFTSFSVGLVIRSLAGYYGGILDSALMRSSEFFQIMPRFFLALLVVATLRRHRKNDGGHRTAQLASDRADCVRPIPLLKEREFVESARAMGFGDWHTIVSEILTNALPPAIVQGTLDIAQAVLLEASLSFFGLGDPRFASWGKMLNRPQPYLRTAYTSRGIVHAVDNVDLKVFSGESVGLVGESGCGKTMTARSILRLAPEPPAKIVGGQV